MLDSLLFTQKLYTLSANFKGRINYLKKKTLGGWDKTTVGGQAKDNWDWLVLAAITLCSKKNIAREFHCLCVLHAKVENKIC